MQFTGTITNRKPLFQRSISMHSLHIRESKTVFDSGFHAMDSRFQVLHSSLFKRKLDTGLQILDSRFQTLWDSGFCELDSRAQDSTFHKQTQAKFSWISQHGANTLSIYFNYLLMRMQRILHGYVERQISTLIGKVKSFGCCQEDSIRYSVLSQSENETIQSVHPSSCATDLDFRDIFFAISFQPFWEIQKRI